MKGTVKFFKPNKGYGFITGEDGLDYYVGESRCIDTIRQNDRVRFNPVSESGKGRLATKVENITFDKE